LCVGGVRIELPGQSTADHTHKLFWSGKGHQRIPASGAA